MKFDCLRKRLFSISAGYSFDIVGVHGYSKFGSGNDSSYNEDERTPAYDAEGKQFESSTGEEIIHLSAT